MSDRTKDVLIRAVKTFAQALIATALTQVLVVINNGETVSGKTFLITVGLPALAAGLSALQNVLFPPKLKGDEDNGEQ